MSKSLIPRNSKTQVSLENKRVEKLYQRISSYIDAARQTVQRTVDTEMVKAYWLIGKDIVEDEQEGKARAEYGKAILEGLSEKLKLKYKRGFSVDTLEQARRFYLIYSGGANSEISEPLARNSELPNFHPNLSWSIYVELMRVARPEARNFYAIEAAKNHWSKRELKRQIGSLLYDRLMHSRDKETVLSLAQKGQEFLTPLDALKEPFVLEFLGLPESHKLIESKVEQALVSNLQHFILELGRGFAFVARQKRLTLQGDHFYADLVFYHVILKCYIIFDIKTRPISHADVGQMLLYVNYFDEEIKMENDNPTLGVVLCTAKKRHCC